eukprot:COSAG06_NODE_42737_length_379_cov_0.553571_1_plen_61_part_10
MPLAAAVGAAAAGWLYRRRRYQYQRWGRQHCQRHHQRHRILVLTQHGQLGLVWHHASLQHG